MIGKLVEPFLITFGRKHSNAIDSDLFKIKKILINVQKSSD